MMLAFAYLLLLAIVALSIPLGVVVARQARVNFSIRLIERAERVAAEAPDAFSRTPAALRKLARRHQRDGRVIITDADGVLVGESGDQTLLGRDYTYRTEIVNALQG